MKVVKYKITNITKSHEVGDIIESIVLLEDHDTGTVLLYHPRSVKGTSASVGIAKPYMPHGKAWGIYVNFIGASACNFINIFSVDRIKEFQDALNKISYVDIILDENDKVSFLGWLVDNSKT